MPLDEVLPLFIWIDKLDRWKEADKLNLMEGRYKLHETNDRVSVLHWFIEIFYGLKEEML